MGMEILDITITKTEDSGAGKLKDDAVEELKIDIEYYCNL